MSQQAVLVERTSARLGGMHFAPRVCSRTSACPITYRSARCGGICAVGNLTAIDRRTEGRVPLRMMCQSRAMTRRNPRNPRRARRSAQRKTLAAVSVTYSQEMPCEADRRSRESSAPAAAPPRAPRDVFGPHAACQRGARFNTSRRAAYGVQHLEHRSTLASSVVANPPISSGTALVLNTAPRWQAAWWRWESIPATSSAPTLLASVEPGSTPAGVPPRPATSSAPTLLASVEPCSTPAGVRPRPATSLATTLLASVEPCSAPAGVALVDSQGPVSYGEFRRFVLCGSFIRRVTTPSFEEPDHDQLDSP